MAIGPSSAKSADISKVYTNDPLLFKTFLETFVEVKTRVGSVYTGFVYTIDPVSESVILLKREDDKISMDIVVGSSVADIRIIPPPDGCSVQSLPLESLFISEDKISEEEAKSRKSQLKSWLCANHFPVVEDGNLLVMEDVIVIDSPYGLNQCLVSNEIIMERVHKLLEQMPWINHDKR